MSEDFLIELSHVDGKTTRVRPQEFRALTLEDMIALTSGVTSSRQMAFRGEVRELTNDQPRQVVSGTMDVVFERPPRPFALVQDGWLPISFVQPRHFFVDRNVVSKLKSLTVSNPRESDSWFSWWVRGLDSNRLVLNPLAYAWESAKRQRPTFSEFKNELAQARQEILQALPQAVVSEFNAGTTAAAFDQLVKFEVREKRQTAFLLEIEPSLRNAPSRTKIEQSKRFIFEVAAKHEVKRNSLVMFAVLSALFGSNHQSSIGRGLIKPKQGYADADAYNVISDLRTIELLTMGLAITPNNPTALATDDIALAKFWCALGLRANMRIPGGWDFSYSLSNLLFASLDSKQIASLNAELNA